MKLFTILALSVATLFAQDKAAMPATSKELSASQIKALQTAYSGVATAQSSFNQLDLARYRAADELSKKNAAWNAAVQQVERECGGVLKVGTDKKIACFEGTRASAADIRNTPPTARMAAAQAPTPSPASASDSKDKIDAVKSQTKSPTLGGHLDPSLNTPKQIRDEHGNPLPGTMPKAMRRGNQQQSLSPTPVQ